MNGKLTIKEIRKVNVGQWVRTKWDDSGNLDTLVTEKQSDHGRVWFKGYFPSDKCVDDFEADQIVAIGKHITCKENGL